MINHSGCCFLRKANSLSNSLFPAGFHDFVLSCLCLPSQLLASRSILQKFRLICPITKGAYGRVFLAKDRATEQPCALKVLRKKQIVKKNMTKEVFRERDLMELMSHMDPGYQHVVHVYQTFQTDYELFIVMVCGVSGISGISA